MNTPITITIIICCTIVALSIIGKLGGKNK